MSNYPAGGYGTLDLDGAVINDPHGYSIELYARDDTGSPTDLLAEGAIAITGGAYAYEGPFAPLTLPVVTDRRDQPARQAPIRPFPALPASAARCGPPGPVPRSRRAASKAICI